jgi:hypothetical protein
MQDSRGPGKWEPDFSGGGASVGGAAPRGTGARTPVPPEALADYSVGEPRTLPQ